MFMKGTHLVIKAPDTKDSSRQPQTVRNTAVKCIDPIRIMVMVASTIVMIMTTSNSINKVTDRTSLPTVLNFFLIFEKSWVLRQTVLTEVLRNPRQYLHTKYLDISN